MTGGGRRVHVDQRGVGRSLSWMAQVSSKSSSAIVAVYGASL